MLHPSLMFYLYNRTFSLHLCDFQVRDSSLWELFMTYDEHYPGGTAGPIASISWVENVVKYAITVIPREKIMLGVAAY